MCDSPDHDQYNGWRGWGVLPSAVATIAVGPWVDLTHPFSADVPRSSVFPGPKVTRIVDMPAKPMSVTSIETVVHMGTHLDAPRHFILDGPGMDEVPLERFTGPGVVISMPAYTDGVIDVDDFEKCTPRIRAGDIVAVSTGWSSRWGTSEWDRHPSITASAARWLCETGVKLLAVDTSTPELPWHLRDENFAFPVHRTLLANGVLIAEQLANLELLANHRVEFIFAPLPIHGSDGSPARVLGRLAQ